jgi:peptide/nickel transport system permease protein
MASFRLALRRAADPLGGAGPQKSRVHAAGGVAGMSPLKIMFEEHLPYVMPIIFSTAMANMIWSIGLEVTLMVLGFTNINIPTVGTTLYWANNHSALVVGVRWWILIPVILIILTFLDCS